MKIVDKILTADFSSGKDRVTARGLWQFDRGVKLKVIGINVTDVNRVDFAPVIASEAVPVVVVPDEDGTFTVSIPGVATKSPYDVTAYIYVDTADYGYTVKAVSMPVILRPEAGKPGEEEKPDPFGEVVEKVSGYAAEARDSARAAGESASEVKEIAEQVTALEERAELSAKSAVASEKAAATSATAAAESASQARESATAARSAANQGAKSATAAAESATAAAQLAANAAQSATNASGSAKSASQSAETAKTAADAASKSDSAAQQAANSATESASTATVAAQTATTAAGKATESATSAGRSAETAGQKATAAETAASNAAESAAEAAKSATAAGDSASAAKTSETAAGEAAQTAQEQADRIEESAEQIEKNKAGVAAIIIEESATGSNIAITDSAKMPLRGLKLFGKSTQVTTTGKNLIDFPDLITSQAKYPVTVTDPNTLKSANALPRNVQLCVSGIYSSDSTENTHKWMWFYIGNNVAGKFEINGPSSVIPEGDITTIYVYFGTGAKNVSLTNVQVEEGTAATSYEPYTGGKPSPSPDFPQEIISAGDSGNIEVDVTGKNLVNIQDVTVGWAQDIQTSLDDLNKHVGETITVTAIFDVISVLNKVSGQYIFQIYTLNTDNEYRAIAGKNLSIEPKVGDRVVIQKVTKLTKKIQKMLLYAFGNNTIGTLGTSKATVQIELGRVATPYEPFKKSTIDFATPNGFRGIPVDSGGNYTDESGQQWICDEVDFERGVYIQRVWTGELDGSDDENWGTYESHKYLGFVANILPERANRRRGFCNYYIVQEEKNVSDAESLWLGVSGNTGMYLHNSRFYDAELGDKGLSNFKVYLAEHPMIVMTYLDNPVETPLTADRIAAYKSLTTHKTTTLFSNDAGAGMEVTYVADPKTYIDNKFAELSQAIVASASEAE